MADAGLILFLLEAAIKLEELPIDKKKGKYELCPYEQLVNVKLAQYRLHLAYLSYL